MSTYEEQSSNSSAEEDDEMKDKPLCAIAPVTIQEESPTDVFSSPAFQCLDELFTSGKIPGARVAELKAKYNLLYETLKSFQESEIQLLQDAKRFTHELEQQKQELEKAEQFPEGSNTEVSMLRQQLLKYNNDLMQTEEREYHLQYKLDCLQEEKSLLEREYERIPKAGELEKRAKLLKESSEELQKENAQRRLEIKALKEDVENKQREIQKEQKELEKKLQQQKIVKEELVQIHNIPAQLGKDMEKINRKIMVTEKEKLQLEEQCQDLNHSLKQVEQKINKIMEEKEAAIKEVDGKRILLENKEREFNHLKKLLEISKEDEAMALGERAALDLNLRHTLLEKQTQHDNLTCKNREKDRELRNIKKAELQFKSANDALAQTQSLYDKIKAELDNFLSPENGTLMERRKELHKEVETTKRQLAEQQLLTEAEVRELEKCISEEEKLVKEQGERREQLVNLTRLVQIKADEREQKSRDLIKAQQRYKQILQEIKARDLAIGEHKKKTQDINKRLKDFAKLYDVLRNERNKCVSLIQMSNQRAAELREKLTILGNEIEILRTNVSNKDRQLQKTRLKLSNNHMIRDSLRKEVGRVSHYLQEMKETKEQQKMEIGRLTNMINQAEEDMVQLRKKYETAVQNRNESGVQLIEREEEVCIFHEKINIQETLLRKGDIEIMALDEKIRFLKMNHKEKKRQIKQAEKSLPNKQALESDLVTLQIQLSQCNDQIQELEKKAENPKTENRIRLLKGREPTFQELMKKIEELELDLTEKEQCLMEKDFLYEHISQLSDKLQQKTESGKEDTISLAKKMNELRKMIKDTNRKMMALIAELSMQQANCIKLQHEAREKDRFVETCYKRLDEGLPPCNEMDQEWEKIVRDEHRRRLDKEQKAKIKEEENQQLLPSGVYTTAEQRPNAYIPDAESALPLPRPYGSLAPFKPSELGSSMRHIRRPVIKPIEI